MTPERLGLERLDPEDREFLEAFDRCEITAREFGHRAHVRLAYILLTLYAPDAARAEMKSGLERLLAHLGAPASKYHETLTTAWTLAVHHFMQITPHASSFEEFATSAPRLFEQEIMQTHYTIERLMSDDARRDFVEPDVQAIPRHTSTIQ